MKNLIPVVFIILSILGFYYLIRPIYDRIPVLNQEISQYKIAVEKAKELSDLVVELGQKYSAISVDRLAKLDKIIPSNPDNMHLAADISAVAGRSAVTVKSLNVADKKSATIPESSGNIDTASQIPYKETAIDISFLSSYQNFLGFLKNLESSLRVMDINSISVASSDKEIYEYRVSITAYSTN